MQTASLPASAVTPIRLRVRELREAKGWTQGELAEKAETHQPTISALESGRSTRVDLPVIERVARALGVSPGYLFVGNDETP